MWTEPGPHRNCHSRAWLYSHHARWGQHRHGRQRTCTVETQDTEAVVPRYSVPQLFPDLFPLFLLNKALGGVWMT